MKLLLRLLRKMRVLDKFNFTIKFPFNRTFKMPVIKSIGFDHFYDAEKWLDHLLKKLLTPFGNRDLFIDVGINIGQTLLKVKTIDRTISYLGFEPNPNCLFYVYELMKCNDFPNTIIFPFALSHSNGVIDLNFYSDNSVDSTASIVPGFRNNNSLRIKVPVVSGDDIIELSSNHVGIIKIDVEGGELDVIKGLSAIIQRDRPLIICEVLPIYSIDNVLRLKRQEELESILKNTFYKISQIDDSGRLVEIDTIGVHSNIDNVNYLFFPQEKCDELKSKLAFYDRVE